MSGREAAALLRRSPSARLGLMGWVWLHNCYVLGALFVVVAIIATMLSDSLPEAYDDAVVGFDVVGALLFGGWAVLASLDRRRGADALFLGWNERRAQAALTALTHHGRRSTIAFADRDGSIIVARVRREGRRPLILPWPLGLTHTLRLRDAQRFDAETEAAEATAYHERLSGQRRDDLRRVGAADGLVRALNS